MKAARNATSRASRTLVSVFLCLAGGHLPAASHAAEFPASSDQAYSLEERSHWSFQPITRTVPPAFDDASARSWIRTPVDAFVLHQLRSVGLEPSPPATPRTLVRRLHFDLLGLPPSPEDTDAFCAEPGDTAWQQLTATLLSNPHYGERWGRHWLDVVRFAESEGYEYDRHLPEAWRYRDYVIAAFNSHEPYDRFIVEQLAGDEIADVGDGQLPTEKQIAALAAAGFQRIGPIRRNAGNSSVVFSRNEVLTEMTDIVGAAFLGMTLGCARCHDHFFDPVRQTDYYRMQAWFAATEPHDRMLVDAVGRQDWQQQVDSLDARVKELQSALVTADGSTTERLKRQIRELELLRPKPLPALFTVQHSDRGRTAIRLLARGDERKPEGPELGPRVPGIFLPDGAAPLGPETPNPRTRLAMWLTAPDHPLTARVMVNRIWQHHFGQALVETPNDFGVNGAAPSHPRLLDWLADEFIRSGWDISHVHRLILHSSTWCQTSVPPEEQLAVGSRVDAANRLYWRQNRRRLSSEEIRDSLLAVSGRLNPQMGGPSVLLPVSQELVNLLYNPAQWSVTADPGEHARRSIYLLTKRNLRLPFMEVFDQADFLTSCPSRVSSTHARQSLELLNGNLTNDLSAAFAARLQQEAGDSADRQVERAFRLVTGRSPTPAERMIALRFLRDARLREFTLAMFSLHAFLYVE